MPLQQRPTFCTLFGLRKDPLPTGYTETRLTIRVRVLFEVLIEDFQGLRRERGSSFSFPRRFAADELAQVVVAALVPAETSTHSKRKSRTITACWIKFWIPDS